ncbi:MAG: hypothetical protein DMG14_18250 [Acidobacteria bacterium]|nr:MAG: hypothetical protein DMG14_18250 [Acidobacteriota bacterium]
MLVSSGTPASQRLKQVAPKRTAKAFDPLARDEAQIFRDLLGGQHMMIRGFSNPDIRNILKLRTPERYHQSPPAKRQGHTHLQPLSCSRIDYQDPHLATLALNQTRPDCDDCIESTAGSSIPGHTYEIRRMTQTSLRKTENVRTKNLSSHVHERHVNEPCAGSITKCLATYGE